MLLSIAAAFAVLRPIAFPPSPIPYEVRRGAALYMAGKGIDRTSEEDRAILGVWFDGRIKRDVEEALWISPSFVSRWLGYLEAREKWFPGEIQLRWNAVRPLFDGRIALVVHLSAYPKWVDSDYGLTGKGDPAEVDDVRFLVTAGGELPEAGAFGSPYRAEIQWAHPRPEPTLTEPHAALLLREQARSAGPLEGRDWVDAMPFLQAMVPEFRQPSGLRGIRLGGFHSAWYLLDLPASEAVRRSRSFDVRVFSPRKERIARFELMSGR